MHLTRTVIWVPLMLGLVSCEWGEPDDKSTADTFSGPMVLAASWQPAFCETATRRPECLSQTRGRYDANHFSLHGLWPQPGTNVYCNVDGGDRKIDKSGRWSKLSALELSSSIVQRLKTTMPGYRSSLHRHEWIKHGTCYAGDAETYYRHSLAVMDALNQSAVRTLFASAIGTQLTESDIRTAFNETFGKGAGQRVRLGCRRDGNRQLLYELTIGLAGKIGETPDLSQLILASPTARSGCPGGIVDPVGYQ